MFDISFKLENIKVDGDIQISQKELEQIQFYTQKITVKEMDEYIEQNLSDLQKAALKYIQNTNELAEKVRILNQLFYRRKQIKEKIKNKSEEKNLAQNLERINEQIRNIILTQTLLKNGVIQTAIFTQKMQEVLGKTTELIYVYQSSSGQDVRLYKISNIQDIIKIQKGHANQLEAKLYANLEMLEKVNQHGQKINQKIKINKDQAKNLDKAYSAIIERYNKYNYGGNKHLILWEMKGNRPKWHGLWRSEKGTLAESYANVILNRKFDSFIGDTNTSRETDIEFFAHLIEQAVGTFGGLEGDVEYENMSAAIKSGSASPQGLLETVKLAQAILNLPKNIDENKFLQIMEKYYKRQQRPLIQKFTNKEYRQLIKQLNN